jgi:hypothetical protein
MRDFDALFPTFFVLACIATLVIMTFKGLLG